MAMTCSDFGGMAETTSSAEWEADILYGIVFNVGADLDQCKRALIAILNLNQKEAQACQRMLYFFLSRILLVDQS